ncbi:MAG: EndoU domain-containing protein, partial [Solirubrobacteraceae bacterium]
MQVSRAADLGQQQAIAALPAEVRDLARHVLLGAFNRRGRPIEFHHAPGGVCPPGRRIDQVVERFPDGTYRAHVSFYHPTRGWVRKADPHTMFPDTWSSEDVMRAGIDAYRSHGDAWLARVRNGTRWRGRHRGGEIRGICSSP